MNPNTVNRLTLISAITGVLIFCTYAVRLQTHDTMPPAPPVAVANATAPETAPTEECGIEDTENIASESADSANAPDVEASDVENKARQAARDFIKEARPELKQDGVFLLSLRADNLYIAGVDTVSDGKHRTVDLLVREYARKNGANYWRAESLSGEEAARLRAEYLKN